MGGGGWGSGDGGEVLTQKLDPGRCKEASPGQQEGAKIRGKEVLSSVGQEEVSSRPVSPGGGGGCISVNASALDCIYVYIVMGCCACRIECIEYIQSDISTCMCLYV